MKLNTFDLRGADREVEGFKEEVTTVINFGKYASQVLYNANSTPTWDGREGEHVLAYVLAGGTFMTYQYYWLDSGWRYTTFSGQT